MLAPPEPVGCQNQQPAMQPDQALLKHEGTMGGEPSSPNDRDTAAEHVTQGSISYMGQLYWPTDAYV